MIDYGIVFFYEDETFVSKLISEPGNVYISEPEGFFDVAKLFPDIAEGNLELVAISQSTEEYIDMIPIVSMVTENVDNIVDYLFEGDADLHKLYDICRAEYGMMIDTTGHTIH